MKFRQNSYYETLPPVHVRHSEFLVPRQIIHTPVDERGLVLVDELIDKVKDTVHPWYEWSGPVNVHHFYWEEEKYPHIYEVGKTNPAHFRDLPIHKGLMFKSFHTWLELVTIPPEPPAQNVMSYRSEAWNVSTSLFDMARSTVQWERRARRRREALLQQDPQLFIKGFDGTDPIGEDYMAEVFERKFRGLEQHIERNERIPEEHRLIGLTGEPEQIARDLGKLVVPRSLNIVPALRAV